MKNWYRESQIFAVQQAHPRTILAVIPPPGLIGSCGLRYIYMLILVYQMLQVLTNALGDSICLGRARLLQGSKYTGLGAKGD